MGEERPSIALIGPAGSGKEVQGKAIEKSNPGFFRGVMGEYLRDFKNRPNHPLAEEVLRIINGGNHLDDDMCCRVFRELVDEIPVNAQGIVMDGFPRSPVQAQETLHAFRNRRFGKFSVIVLDVPRRVCETRLVKRGEAEERLDDLELKKIRARLDRYETHVIPAIEFFKNEGVPLLTVDGNRPREFITREIARWLHDEWTGRLSMGVA